jgi:hypothetical protein
VVSSRAVRRLASRIAAFTSKPFLRNETPAT